ncbi:MAG: hypothetical protein IT304_03985 [Dehalococcoidia bacterium]|nr:hypothetical protein [Dehalococcoidia bacterium]
MIFLDRSIPRSVAEALKAVRPGEIRWLEDDSLHSTPDEVWIPEVARREWLAISRDKNIRRRSRQRELVFRHGLGCFILSQRHDPTRWQYLKLLAATLDEMERLFRHQPRPFMYLVDGAGRFSPYQPPGWLPVDQLRPPADG